MDAEPQVSFLIRGQKRFIRPFRRNLHFHDHGIRGSMEVIRNVVGEEREEGGGWQLKSDVVLDRNGDPDPDVYFFFSCSHGAGEV